MVRGCNPRPSLLPGRLLWSPLVERHHLIRRRGQRRTAGAQAAHPAAAAADLTLHSRSSLSAVSPDASYSPSPNRSANLLLLHFATSLRATTCTTRMRWRASAPLIWRRRKLRPQLGKSRPPTARLNLLWSFPSVFWRFLLRRTEQGTPPLHSTPAASHRTQRSALLRGSATRMSPAPSKRCRRHQLKRLLLLQSRLQVAQFSSILLGLW